MLLVKQFNLVSRVWKPLVTSVRWVYPKAFQDVIRTKPEQKCTMLPNGLTVVCEQRPIYHVSVGIFLQAGPRYENVNENGMTHFFEHLVFKSTVSRDSQVLEKLLSCTAAHFRSFTEREMCGYYADCLPGDTDMVVDLLADCIFRNRLDEAEIELQKQIVYREMEEQDSDTNAVLFDYLHGAAYMGTPLEQSVLGPCGNLQCYNVATLSYYLNKHFLPSRTVLAAVGNTSLNQLVELANRHLCGTSQDFCIEHLYRFTGGDFRYRDDSLPYCNLAFAWEAPGLSMDRAAFTLEVASSLLGAWNQTQPGGELLSSPLAQAAHSGLADGYKPFYIKYKDCGLWGVQAHVQRMEVDDWVSAYAYELMRLCTMAAEPELVRAKNALKVHLINRYENTSKSLIDNARWTLCCGCQPSLADRIDGVDAVTIEDLKHYLDHFVYDKCPAVAAVGSCEQLLNYSRLRSHFYWLRT